MGRYRSHRRGGEPGSGAPRRRWVSAATRSHRRDAEQRRVGVEAASWARRASVRWRRGQIARRLGAQRTRRTLIVVVGAVRLRGRGPLLCRGGFCSVDISDPAAPEAAGHRPGARQATTRRGRARHHVPGRPRHPRRQQRDLHRTTTPRPPAAATTSTTSSNPAQPAQLVDAAGDYGDVGELGVLRPGRHGAERRDRARLPLRVHVGRRRAGRPRSVSTTRVGADRRRHLRHHGSERTRSRSRVRLRRGVRLIKTGAGERLEDGNALDTNLHDMVVREISGVRRMLASYWDGGYVLLDIERPGASPKYIGDTRFDREGSADRQRRRLGATPTRPSSRTTTSTSWPPTRSSARTARSRRDRPGRPERVRVPRLAALTSEGPIFSPRPPAHRRHRRYVRRRLQRPAQHPGRRPTAAEDRSSSNVRNCGVPGEGGRTPTSARLRPGS